MDSLWWLWLIVAPLAVLAGILLFATWFARRVIEQFIGRKHRWIEEIMRTGEAPDAWSRRAQWPDIVRKLQRHSAPEKAKASYLRQLDDLIAYTERSPLMGDAETKEVVLQRLDEVYDEWDRRSPESFRSLAGAAAVSPPHG